MQLFFKKIFEPFMTAPVISNEEMDDMVKIVKFFEDAGLLIKGICEAIEN